MNFSFHILGISSFQLTIRHIFQRGWLKPPTRYDMGVSENGVITLILMAI